MSKPAQDQEKEVAERRRNRRRGAATKRTPSRVTIILEAINKGLPYKFAAEAAGIHEGTLHEWRRTIPEFSMQVRQAEIKAITRGIECIEKAAQRGDWRAAAWLLERRDREFFMRESVAKPQAEPSTISIAELLYPERRAERKLLGSQ